MHKEVDQKRSHPYVHQMTYTLYLSSQSFHDLELTIVSRRVRTPFFKTLFKGVISLNFPEMLRLL